MSDTDTGTMHGLTDGGVSGNHTPPDDFQILAGTSTSGEFNTARFPLVPIACWRVHDIRFDFDSSFVLPGVRKEMALLARLIASHTRPARAGTVSQPPPVSFFGHADPVGNDAVNKPLSGRRAAAIYGMVTRRVEIWEELYSNTSVVTTPAAGDIWGTRSIQIMLNQLAGPVDIDGKMGPQTEASVRSFQTQNGLSPDGDAGPATRKKLFLAYMNALCIDGGGATFQIDKTEGFLARNEDAGGKGDFQGCSAFNPLLIFSSTRNAAFEQNQDKTARNAANAPNRRVMALLFKPGTRVDPGKWPCPRAKEGTAGCVKRLFSDGEARRRTRLPDKDRKADPTHDTFACRFYQRLLTKSPCETIAEFVPLRILLIDCHHKPVKQTKYKLEIEDLIFEGVTGDDGGFIQMIPDIATKGVLKIEAWTVGLDIVPVTDAAETRGARLRFENLGLAAVDEGLVRSARGGLSADDDALFRRATLRFQSMVDIRRDGRLNEQTVAKLKEVYGS